MSTIFKVLLNSGFVQKFMTSEIRHGATFLSGLILAWLLSHGFHGVDAGNIADGIAAIVVGLGGYGMSKLNASNNAAVTQVAAATGQVLPAKQAKAILKQGMTVQRQADQVQADKTGAAIAQAAKDAPATAAAIDMRLDEGTI